MGITELLEESKNEFYIKSGIITGSKPFEIYVGYFETEAKVESKKWVPLSEMSESETRIHPSALYEGGYTKPVSKSQIKFQNIYREERRYAKTEAEAEKLLSEIVKEIEKKLTKKDAGTIKKITDELLYQSYGEYVPKEKQDKTYNAKKKHFEEEIAKSLTSEVYKTFISEVKDLVIDNSQTMIGEKAFKGRGLRSVVLDDRISIIASDAFADNELESVTLPEKLGVIGERAFANNKLKNVYIPANVTSIRAEAFRDNNLETVEFDPESELTYIGSETFAGNNLEKIDFPKRLSRLYDDAFDQNIDYTNSGAEIVTKTKK